MTFQQAVQTCFTKYAAFSGRAARSEFWYWQLFLTLAGLIVAILDTSLSLHSKPFGLIYYLVTLLPTLAVGARRLHDTGRSAWWLLLLLVPIAGSGVLFYYLAEPSMPGPNKFGDALFLQ